MHDTGIDLNCVFFTVFPYLGIGTLVLALPHKPAVIILIRVLFTGRTRIWVFGSPPLDPRVLVRIGWGILNDSRQH